MHRAADQLELLVPALLFLLGAVPLAHLLGRLGLFDAVAARLAHRGGGLVPWWILACLTTAVLNLDTAVVLLTPLFVRIGRRRGQDPLAMAVIPLLAADLASSVLPVSNLTTLVAVGHLALRPLDLVTGLGPATLAMVGVAVVVHRRWSTTLVGAPGAVSRGAATAPPSPPANPSPPGPASAAPAAPTVAVASPPAAPSEPPDDRRALVVGGVVVGALLLAFVLGPAVGIAPWQAVLAADAALVLVVRDLPWRSVPLATAAGVALLGATLALVVSGDGLAVLVDRPGPLGAAAGAATAAAMAATFDNLPALLALLPATSGSGTLLPVLLGVNAGAVLTPIGSLANLLWLRTARRDGLTVGWAGTLRLGVRLGGPALLTGVAVLTAQRALVG